MESGASDSDRRRQDRSIESDTRDGSLARRSQRARVPILVSNSESE